VDSIKLAYLAPEFLPTWGGVGIYSVELIKNLKNMEIHVITPRRGLNYNKKKVENYFNNNVKIHNISNSSDDFFYNLKFQYSLLKQFQRLNKKYKFDIIHAANLVHMPDVFLKFKKLNIPSLTTIHTTLKSQSHIRGEKKLKKNIWERSTVENLTSLCYPYIKFLESVYLSRSNNFIAVSNWIKNFVNDKQKNIDVIHNGIDTKKFSATGNKRFELFDEVDKPVVLFSGRLMALKGMNVLIESIKQISKKEDLYFVFAGTGDIKKWESMLKGVPKENYKFLGYVDYQNISQLYCSSDMFVLPSYTESFPLTILEAMAAGLPIISSKVGGIPEMIENNKNGILINPGNSKILSKSIINLLDNSSLRKRIGRNARTIAKNKFDSKIMAIKTKKFYEQVLAG